MISMNRVIICTALCCIVFVLPMPTLYGQGHGGKISKELYAEQSKSYPPLPDPGKKIPLGDNHYFIYSFDKKPRMGTLIMKVEIFNREGTKDTSFVVKADADMPSMRGAHATGEKPFTVSKKNDYLLPISIVMPGDWEIKLTILKDGNVVIKGRYNFNV